MALPCYASTEWEGLGHATLRFRPKRKSTQPVEALLIECFMSAVYIGEYGEKKDKKKTREPQNYLQPPGIPPEVWTGWEEHWEAWKEILIPLSWVHKYRDHCTPEFIKWHDSYLKDYPQVLPLITDELGRSELSEDTAVQSDNDIEENRKKVLDELYEKHTKLRYFVHLRSFLHSSGIECHPEIESFYENEAGINFISSSAESCSSITCDTEELSSVVSGEVCSLDGEGKPEENHPQVRSEPSFKQKENITLDICTTNNCSDHESDSDYGNSLQYKANDNQRKQQIEEIVEKNDEDSNKTPTSKKKLKDRSFIFQEAEGTNSRKEKLVGDELKEGSWREAEGMKVEDSSSISDEGVCMQSAEPVTVDTASSSVKNKQKMAKKRKRDEARSHGVSWTLKYVQKKESKDSKQIKEVPEVLHAVSMTPKSKEALPQPPEASHGSHEGAFKFSKVASESPKAAPEPSEAAPEPSETAPELPEAAREPSEAAPEPPEAAPEPSMAAPEPSEAAPELPEVAPKPCEGAHEAVPELSMPVARSSKTAHFDSDEEGECIRAFLDYVDDGERVFWQKYAMSEGKASRESLQERPTCLSRLKGACQASMNRAHTVLQELLLPLTALHLLNLSFPGAAAIEYESSVTEEVPGEREKLKFWFDSFVFDVKERFKSYLRKLGRFCCTTWMDAVVPVGIRHITNIVFQYTSEIEHQFPPDVFGVRWLPDPEPSFHVDGKNVKRSQRRLFKWLEVQNPNLDPSATVELTGLVMNRMNCSDQDPRRPQRLYQQVVRIEKEESGCPCITLHTLHLLKESNKASSVHGGTKDVEEEWLRMEVNFDQDGFSGVTNCSPASESTEDTKAEAEAEMWQRITSGCHRLTFWEADNSMPAHLPSEIQKYWAQRYRLFLKFDEGINLDTESWYSVTPELLAAHQARRCRCEVVVDALCGAGGNAIQLAKTSSHVIAIDKDPKKVDLARHNAEVYGVAHRIDFRVGDFFKMAPSLKADVVYLSPPWGGMEYSEECTYDVYRLGGTMNCARLLRTARAITPNVALYLPRNSNLYQVIALAGVDGVVDIEANYMGPKKKAITAYFGDLATRTEWC